MIGPLGIEWDYRGDDPEDDQIVRALMGKTISRVSIRREEGCPEGIALGFTDGTAIQLYALGWHDIQSLVIVFPKDAS